MKIFHLLAAICLAASVSLSVAQDAYTPDELEAIKTMGREAIEEVVAKFAADYRDEGIGSIAILPIQRDVDSGYFTIQIENAFSKLSDETGLEVFTRDDASLATALSEIEWNQNFVDVIDPATIQRFGRIQGAEAVAFTRIDMTRLGNNSFSVRANLQVREVETAKTIWGNEVVRKTAAIISPKQMRLFLIIGGCVLVAIVFLGLVRRSLKKARRPR